MRLLPRAISDMPAAKHAGKKALPQLLICMISQTPPTEEIRLSFIIPSPAAGFAGLRAGCFQTNVQNVCVARLARDV